MNVDPSKVQLSERDIEEWLYRNPQAVPVSSYTDRTVDKWIGRQVELPSGIADLVGLSNATPVVVEVKNVEVDSAALTQVCRYAEDIERVKRHYDTDSITGVLKIVIGKGEVSDRILYEANALNVRVISFRVKLSLEIGGIWAWNQNHRDSLKQRYADLAESPIFNEARAVYKEWFNEAESDGDKESESAGDGE